MSRREQGSRTPVTGCQASRFCPRPSFQQEGCKQENSQLAAPKLAKKQLQLVLPGALLRAVSIKQTASRRDWDTGRQAGDTTPEPASQHLASDRRGWETHGGRHHPGASVWHLTAEARQLGDSVTRKIGKQTPQPASHHSIWHLTAETLGDIGRQAGDTSQRRRPETERHKARSRRHSIWHPTTGRQAKPTQKTSGRHDPEPASQHLHLI